MPPLIRRVIVLVALAVSMSSAALGQTVCDQLLPIGLVPGVDGFLTGCGNRYVIRRAGASPPPRSWVALVYPACPNGPCAGQTGPAEFMCETTSGYFCCIAVADSIPLVAGIYTGPFISALSQRFASDADTSTSICFSNYAGNGSRLTNVPLIHSFGLGTTKVQVTAFQRMFLVRPPEGNGDVLVEFVDGPTAVRSETWGRTKVRYR